MMNARLALALLFTFLLPAFSQDEASPDETPDAPQDEALLVSDPTIAIEELELRLVPLTVEEIEIEADAWQDLVREKAAEVAQASLALRDPDNGSP